MSDDEELSSELLRANRAQVLLENPLLIECFENIKRDLLKFWEERTKSDDTAERERLWQAVQIVGKVESMLRSYISDGKLAGAQIRELSRLGEKPKPRVLLDFAKSS